MVFAFFTFLITQIIWGEVLRDYLVSHAISESYTNINVILWTGLGFIFGVSITVSLIAFSRDFYIKPIFYANMCSLGITILILFVISYIGMYMHYTDVFTSLTPLEELRLVPYYYIFFAVYVLNNPILFWYIALCIYHLTLIFFIKLLYKKKPAGRAKAYMRSDTPLYTSIFLGDSPKQKKKYKKKKSRRK